LKDVDHVEYYPAAGTQKKRWKAGKGAGVLMGKESDEEASLSASFHLFFFISKLTST
jgi:hypothetical protein